MATGKIKVIKNGYGFIKQDDGGPDVYFKVAWVENISRTEVIEGLQVEYETQKTDKGLQTKWVRALETRTHHKQPQPATQRSSRQPLNDEYRFLNPYNFVRFLPEPKQKDIRQSIETQLLWRCPPPPHDRYIGLTGRITCEVEAITPLFVSDSHGVEGKDHKTYRFFQYDNKPAIPASTLRGMVRSVFEVVTNSCMSILTDKQLSQHFDSKKAPWLVPARIEKSDDRWQLRLLTGTTNLQIYETNKEPQGTQYAAWLHRYWPMQPSKTLTKQPPSGKKVRFFQQRTQQGREVSISQMEHGQKCYALLQEVEHPHPRIIFWDVIAIDTERKNLERKLDRSQRQKIEQGWLCSTNQNIESKHSERFFFRTPSNRVGPEVIELPEKICRDYVNLIADYQGRHQDEVKERLRDNKPLAEPIQTRKGRREAGLSRFVYSEKEKKLNGGELVYAFLTGTVANPQVEFIVPVSLPRVNYENSIGDLLAEYLHICNNYNSLCPACRTFGWVWKRQDKEEKQPDLTAYAGRVRFSHGTLTHKAGTLPDSTTLVILSTPKPTTTLFYLLDSNGNPNGSIDYNIPNAQLRGRKVYRHHGDQLRKEEYTRTLKNDQNRTVHGALEKGSTFTFTIDFENLADIELGALLWALEFEGDGTMFHRLGYAKPLGFGSVKIRVTGLEQMKPENRYISLDSWNDGWDNILSQKKGLKERFTKAITELYNESEFGQLPPIQDLQTLLNDTAQYPIHYPRPIADLKAIEQGKEENFRWFGDNKEPLQLAPNDNGFTIPPRGAGQKGGKKK